MGMTHELTFELNGDQIKTTSTDDPKEIENHLSSFLRPSINHQTKVIGFDAQWSLHNCLPQGPLFLRPRCETIQLCDGHSCLIIQLDSLQSYYFGRGFYYREAVGHKSLVNFLSLPNITFVGVGIKENLAKLEKYYGIGCKNAVELGPLAATVMNMPSLSLCGVDELAFLVNGFDLHYDSFSAKVATVYSYHKIGAELKNRRPEPANAATSEENVDSKVVGRTQFSETKPNKHVKIEPKS